MDWHNTTHQWSCMTWLRRSSKRHRMLLKQRQEQTHRCERHYGWHISLLALKGSTERYSIHGYYTARTALKKDIGTCAHSLIKLFIRRHYTAPTSSRKRWDELCGHTLATQPHQRHSILLQHGQHSRKKSIQYMDRPQSTHSQASMQYSPTTGHSTTNTCNIQPDDRPQSQQIHAVHSQRTSHISSRKSCIMWPGNRPHRFKKIIQWTAIRHSTQKVISLQWLVFD